MRPLEINFKEMIKEYRHYFFLTQNELGEKLGVSYVTVNRWENGVSIPSMKQKKKLYSMFVEAKLIKED